MNEYIEFPRLRLSILPMTSIGLGVPKRLSANSRLLLVSTLFRQSNILIHTMNLNISINDKIYTDFKFSIATRL